MTRYGEKDDDRRAFLKTCGRFAAVTPPVMSLLLSTSLTSKAIARSGGLNGTASNDRSQSFFDNDRSSGDSSVTFSGGGGGGGGGGGFGGGGRPSSPHAAAASGGESGFGAGKGGGTKGPFATGGSSGVLAAEGGVDCANEDDRKKADCDFAHAQVPSVYVSKQ